MLRILHHRTFLMRMALAIGLLATATRANAGSTTYEAYAYVGLSYDLGALPDTITTQGVDASGFNPWFGDKGGDISTIGATSGYAANQYSYWSTDRTGVGLNAVAYIYGSAEADFIPQKSDSYSVAYSGSYYRFLNSGSDPVQLQITLYHFNEASASAYLGLATGYAFAESEVRLEVYSASYAGVLDRWYVRADENHSHASINLDNSYNISLAPGITDIGLATFVYGYDSVTATAAAVPEPGSLSLLGLGTVTLIGAAIRRKRKPTSISTR